MTENFFGRSSLSAKEFEKYYNQASADRRGYRPRNLPLESLHRRDLLTPASDNNYAYWQIFILHDIMQMKVEYVFDFTDDGVFSRVRNRDFHNIDSELIAGPFFGGGIREYKSSKDYGHCYAAVSRFIDFKRQLEEPYILKATGKWGEEIEIPNRKIKLNKFAEQSLVERGISSEEFLEFLKFQCNRWEEEGYPKIADEYKKNIKYTVEIYRRIAGNTFDELAELVGSGDGNKEYFLDHEKLVLDRIFPDWERIAKFKADPTIESICQRNLGLLEHDAERFKTCVSEKDFQHFYLSLSEINENFNYFNPEGTVRLQRTLRSLAIYFEEWCEKLSEKEGTLKEKLKACWSPEDSKSFFSSGGYFDNYTKGIKGGIINAWESIESINFRNLEPQISDEKASLLLKAALIRNYVIHNKIDHEENVPVTKYAITLTEAMILTWWTWEKIP